jgi:hypothetical protein
MKITTNTVDNLLKQAKFRESFKKLPKGKTYQDLSTIIIIPTRGVQEEKHFLNCKKCKTKNEYTTTIIGGLSPIFVEAFKRLIKPMNVPVLEMMIQGLEVGHAYNTAVENILGNPSLKNFKYVLTIEDDNIVPFIPESEGPLMMLYEDIEKGFDVAGGLYWTKGVPSMPLIYGDPKNKNKDSSDGMFKVRMDWQNKKPGPIECNGMGMGFTLFKMDIFKDTRIKKPWFKTCSEHTEGGIKQYTQDLYFFEKIRKLDYKVCVDTRIKVGHLDIKSGIIY